jgi:hypothetical protein
MRDLPDVKLFSSGLIDDMHKAFETVCAKLRLSPKSDKATALVVNKIVELAKAGRRGDELTAEALRFFDACEPERRGDQSRPMPSMRAVLRSVLTFRPRNQASFPALGRHEKG